MRAWGVVHGVNPCLHGPQAILDLIYHYVGQDWKKVAMAYGPLYTLISIRWRRAKGALWGMGSAGGTLYDLALRAAARVRSEVRFDRGGESVVGHLCDGGAHNDLITTQRSR